MASEETTIKHHDKVRAHTQKKVQTKPNLVGIEDFVTVQFATLRFMREQLGDCWFRRDGTILECSELIPVAWSWFLSVSGLPLEDVNFIDTKPTRLDSSTIRVLNLIALKCYLV
ncbi:hypothetical protein CMV_013355 [Castanea mollissima]|uniref:Uncharacterized protein n=1 Tax=Castanea mollissima TaxID=60419 RepID=A0A8J4QZJ9_9ROSI|nr:hypothetical protein CMV_013355 [Castanea mollissima]